MSPIQLFAPKFRVDECLDGIRECLEKGWTGLGYKTVEIEEAWKNYTGLPNAHFVNSATSGLHLAIRLLKEAHGWQAGDEIITTPITFVSTNHAILYESLTPNFADVDEHLCLSPQSVEERMNERVKAVIFVGMGGNSGQLPAISEICRDNGVKLILDAAHMAGTYVNDIHVGHESDVSVFSFHAVKNLPTADSGMVCFRDDKLDSLARKWSWMGINKDTFMRTGNALKYKWQYEVESVGFKYHGNSIMAAIALVGLKYLDDDNKYRNLLASCYDQHLLNNPNIQRIPIAAGCRPSRHLYQVMVDKRDEVILSLNEHSIFPGVHYQINTDFPMYNFWKGSCIRAEAMSNRIISLPMHCGLKEDDIERICVRLTAATER